MKSFPSIPNKKFTITILSVLAAAFLFSLIMFFVTVRGRRYTFVFPSVESGKYVVESRRLRKNEMTEIEYYVSELLLGPCTERTEGLAASGTKVLSCIRKGHVLYLDLSRDFIKTESRNLTMQNSLELLKKNIKNNFPSINKMEVFIEGKQAFAGY